MHAHMRTVKLHSLLLTRLAQNPPYLRTSFPRPSFKNFPTEPFIVYNESVEFDISDVPLAKNGVALMGFGASTHAFDQGQRYMAISFEHDAAKSTIRVRPFQNTSQVLIPGDYVMYLISADSVPSIGKHVTLVNTQKQSNSRWKLKHIWIYISIGVAYMYWVQSRKDPISYKTL